MTTTPNIEKLGNAIIYLNDRIPNLYMTKLLKLLYILDEISINETGQPFSWLDYKVWKNGPVAKDVWHVLSGHRVMNDCWGLLDYVQTTPESNPIDNNQASRRIKSKKIFNDDEFADYDMALMDKVINLYGGKGSDELIGILHAEGSEWSKLVERHDLEEQFKSQRNTSNVSILYHEMIKDKPELLNSYKAGFEALNSEI